MIVTSLAELVVPTLVVGNFKLEGVIETGRIPVPARLTDCGLLLELSVRVKAADLTPVCCGAKATLTVQEAFALRTPPQVEATTLKSAELVPVSAQELRVTASPVLLVMVTFLAELVLPRACRAKDNVAGETWRGGVMV